MPRIISGKFKNKKLLVADKVTRPLTDRIKTSIFDTIQELIPNAIVLDIFAGSGSFGLEAISRGSKHVTFIENNDTAIDLLSKNINNTDSKDNTYIFGGNITDFIKSNTQSFNIIFLDPPFPRNQKLEDLKNIIPFLLPDGLIIIRTPTNEISEEKDLQQDSPISKVYEKIYGESRVSFWRN